MLSVFRWIAVVGVFAFVLAPITPGCGGGQLSEDEVRLSNGMTRLQDALSGRPDQVTLVAAHALRAGLTPAEIAYIGDLHWDHVTEDVLLHDPILRKGLKIVIAAFPDRSIFAAQVSWQLGPARAYAQNRNAAIGAVLSGIQKAVKGATIATIVAGPEVGVLVGVAAALVYTGPALGEIALAYLNGKLDEVNGEGTRDDVVTEPETWRSDESKYSSHSKTTEVTPGTPDSPPQPEIPIPPPPECLSSSDCRPDYACVASSCQCVPGCPSNLAASITDCGAPVANKCSGGPDCGVGTLCPLGEACTDGACQACPSGGEMCGAICCAAGRCRNSVCGETLACAQFRANVTAADREFADWESNELSCAQKSECGCWNNNFPHPPSDPVENPGCAGDDASDDYFACLDNCSSCWANHPCPNGFDTCAASKAGEICVRKHELECNRCDMACADAWTRSVN